MVRRPGVSRAGAAKRVSQPHVPSSQRPPEVVWVYDQFRLIDAESYQHGYSRKDGCPLDKGHYIVAWPSGMGDRTYGDEAVFHGPYRTRKEAEIAVERLQFLPRRGAPSTRVGPPRRRPAMVEAIPVRWSAREEAKPAIGYGGGP